jgi:hypothetical protein
MKQPIQQPMKQPKPLSHELDRWEDEGGALPAENADRAGDRSAANVSKRYAALLKDIDATGGYHEPLTEKQRHALMALIEMRLVARTTYRAGLVTYGLSEAGRRIVEDLQG